jgi:hypothetical protein
MGDLLKKMLTDLVKAHPEIVAAVIVKAMRDEADKIEKDPSIVTAWINQILG